jgi:hypothetical protein
MLVRLASDRMDKQYIIDEIKRTAQENGGIPLGRGRFTNETGIRISDCSGRFWVRWGAMHESRRVSNPMRCRAPTSLMNSSIV